MKKVVNKKILPQIQKLPGSEKKMKPQPVYDYPEVKGSAKMKGKVALITGGDSGIGRAVAVLFAKEGADIAISYLSEHEDAKETKTVIEQYGQQCLLIAGDVSKEGFCKKIVQKTIGRFGKLTTLVNNAAMQVEAATLEALKTKNLIKTFEANIFSMFWITKYALPYLHKGSTIINTSSVTAYRGSPTLLDYSSTKGAIVAFTRSLAQNLVDKEIRVNGVAPGPIWTPLIPASYDAKKTAQHGKKAPMERAGQPVEVAPCYLFLATDDSSYMSGQFLHPNGGELVNG